MPASPLFGGALSATLPPGRWLDASDVRPVPDHQEVWLECDVDDASSIIVEVLERAECTDEGAAAFHFEDLATSNAADSFAVVKAAVVPVTTLMPSLRDAGSCSILHGVQVLPAAAAAVGGTGAGDATPGDSGCGESVGSTELDVHLAVVRLEAHATDLLISVCRPRRGPNGMLQAQDVEVLLSTLRSLEIHDTGLFAVS